MKTPSRFAAGADALLKHEPFYLLPLGLLPLGLAPVLPAFFAWGGIAVVLASWVVRIVRGHFPLRATRLGLPMVIFLVATIIGLYPSVDLRLSMERFYGVVAGLALYYMIVNSALETYLKYYVFVFFAASLALAVWATGRAPLVAFDQSNLIWMIEGFQRVIPSVTSYAVHPNGIAGMLVVVIPLAGALTLLPYSEKIGESRNRGTARASEPTARSGAWRSVPFLRAFSLLTFLGMILFLLLTNSRAGFLAFMVSFFVCAAVINWRFLLLAPVVAGAGYQFVVRFVSAPERLIDTANGVSRLDLWQSAYYMLQDFLYTGIGLGAFPYIYPLYRLRASQTEITNVHNAYLQVFLDQGLLGFSSWVVILCVVALAILRVIHRSRRGSFERALGVGLAGSYVAFVLQGILEASVSIAFRDSFGTFHVATSPLPFILAGLAIRLETS